MLEFSALLQMLPAVALFISQHWDSIVAVCTAIVLSFQAMKSRQYDKMWPTVLELVKKLANEELSGPDKRKEVSVGISEMVPLWLKPFVTQTEIEKLAEQAYQYLRGELKEQNK